jgi:predicted AlkP superfamily pyrophosphatase or phosphodiesterase
MPSCPGPGPRADDDRRFVRRRLPAALLVVGFAVAALLASPTPSGPAIAEHVVIISLDGLRPDAIGEARAETLLSLIRRGAYAPKARTIRPSVTVPAHTSMLTGFDSRHHRVLSNGAFSSHALRRRHVAIPTIFSLARDAGLSTAMFYSKVSLSGLADLGGIDTRFGPLRSPREASPPASKPVVGVAERAPGIDFSPDRVAEAFADAWARRTFALSFVHLREPDQTGHREGWMTPAYLEGVRTADRAVARLVEALARAGVLENTAIIVTADHGGIGGTKRHLARADPDNPEAVTIPWICVGPGVPAGLSIDRAVRVHDTAPTALVFLGLPIPPEIDGHPVTEVLRAAKP